MNTTASRAAWTLWILVLLSPPGLADYDTGLAAYNNGDWAVAAQELKPVADAGHHEAQFLMGTLHGSGKGVDPSMTEALRYYRLSAEQNNIEAQAAIAFTFRVGNGVKQDYEEAAKWYRLAAERGLGDAQFNFGSLCAAGRGVPQSYSEAYKWFSLAAAHGIEEAVVALFFSMDHLSEEQISQALQAVTEWKPKE